MEIQTIEAWHIKDDDKLVMGQEYPVAYTITDIERNLAEGLVTITSETGYKTFHRAGEKVRILARQ